MAAEIAASGVVSPPAAEPDGSVVEDMPQGRVTNSDGSVSHVSAGVILFREGVSGRE